MVKEILLLILNYVSQHLLAEKSKWVQTDEWGTEQVLKRDMLKEWHFAVAQLLGSQST